MREREKLVCPNCGITSFITTKVWTEKGWQLQYRCAICTKVLHTVPSYSKEEFKNGKFVESRYESSN